jgi:hypothetical protein
MASIGRIIHLLKEGIQQGSIEEITIGPDKERTLIYDTELEKLVVVENN